MIVPAPVRPIRPRPRTKIRGQPVCHAEQSAPLAQYSGGKYSEIVVGEHASLAELEAVGQEGTVPVEGYILDVRPREGRQAPCPRREVVGEIPYVIHLRFKLCPAGPHNRPRIPEAGGDLEYRLLPAAAAAALAFEHEGRTFQFLQGIPVHAEPCGRLAAHPVVEAVHDFADGIGFRLHATLPRTRRRRAGPASDPPAAVPRLGWATNPA